MEHVTVTELGLVALYHQKHSEHGVRVGTLAQNDVLSHINDPMLLTPSPRSATRLAKEVLDKFKDAFIINAKNSDAEIQG